MKPIQEKIILSCFRPHHIGDVDHLYLLPHIGKVGVEPGFIISRDSRMKFREACPVYLAEDYLSKPHTGNNTRFITENLYKHPFYYFVCIK